MKLLLLAVFGLAGVYSRYFIEKAYIITPDKFPFHTFAINLVGSCIAGICYYYLKNTDNHLLSSAVLVGLCGGLTTFSGFSLQLFNLLNLGQYTKVILYITLSPLVGIICAFMGYRLAMIAST